MDCRNDIPHRIALAIACWSVPALMVGCRSLPRSDAGEFVQYGAMHEVVALGDDKGRVALRDIAQRPHFYAVGALEALRGEVTVLDSEVFASRKTPAGGLEPLAVDDLQAALLAGQSCSTWTTIAVHDAVPYEDFDSWIAQEAAEAGLTDLAPFVFVIEGEFSDLHLHVINGACPVHARMKGITLEPDVAPFEMETEHTRGTIVGLFAPDSVGKLTHPATNNHSHLIFTDPATGERVTGHIERVGVSPGSVLKLAVPR